MKSILRNPARALGSPLSLVVAALMISPLAGAAESRDTLILTSTNSATSNSVVVFKLDMSGTPSLTLQNMLPTGGLGGASGNAGGLQFKEEFGAVVNYASNTVTKLSRYNDWVGVAGTINLTKGCVHPLSVALTETDLYSGGANCAEAHDWPSGRSKGPAVKMPDTSMGQLVVGRTWAAVTMTSGSVLQLPLAGDGSLKGTSTSVALPADANNTPLGAAFWGDLLGFNPAHSADSFVLVNSTGSAYPVLGPQPAYPMNAPCWLAKGPGNLWYSGNSPGHAVSIFFSDGQGGEFYKSIAVGGVPTDITVSADKKLLAVIYTAADGGHVAVFCIDNHGDLSLVATSSAIGVASFNGVAISQ